MTPFIIQHFENLKRHVLSVAELKNISPSDCKVLSLLIFRKTNQQVSETTLKRVYGFAYSKFKPSSFTLDALAMYCGYEGWADFYDNTSLPVNRQSDNLGWDSIKHNAEKTTNFTLQALKNKSVIPYSQTIKRRFIDDHFEAFAKSDCVATIITAPAGTGKTIALCHWIEEKLEKTNSGENNDIVLFFSSNALINVFITGKDINDWLLSLLGYSAEDDFSALLDHDQKQYGTFYLIIDGLDEHMFKNEQFHLLLNQIIDIFSFYEHYNNFKMVLTMRAATWLNNCNEFELFKSKCFLNLQYEAGILKNVPLFSNREINELSHKINLESNVGVDDEILKNFRHPLYFQYYYKQHKLDFSLNKTNSLSIYELVSTFMLNKIYLGPQATEKNIFIKLLVDHMDFKKQNFAVDKLRIADAIKLYHQAYNDLLGIGFIRELNKSVDMQYNTIIEFADDNYLNYSIARQLLYNNNNVFDAGIVQVLNSNFKDERKVSILKWNLIYAAKNGQYNVYKFMSEITLNAEEKLDIMNFIGDVLKKQYPLLSDADAFSERP